jgi:hypothetical protein
MPGSHRFPVSTPGREIIDGSGLLLAADIHHVPQVFAVPDLYGV